MKSKFEFKDNRPLNIKVKSFLQSMLFWRGRSKGMIYTRNIELEDIREIFFPKTFSEKYSYLGAIPYRDDSDISKAIRPLVLAMDYEAKPKWCPRWFLRFLNVFGNDKSIVRVRNRRLANLFRTLTKGIMMWDYKTKWEYYDLRISISAPKYLQDLASDIERGFYSRGRQQELVDEILKLDPNASIIWGDIERLKKQLDKLKNKTETK
jgi:hypothetical protein